MDSEQRLLKRFDIEFEKGLANVKFFVKQGRISLSELTDELNKFEDASASPNDCAAVTSVDRGCAMIRFDVAFA